MSSISLNQAIQNLATASQTLKTAQNDLNSKQNAWTTALRQLGLATPPLPPLAQPADLNVLANALVASKANAANAQVAYTAAKAAYDDALKTAGVVLV